jgi:hypothetical protein
MRMNKTMKIVVGLATAWVTLYPVVFMAAWLASFFGVFWLPESSLSGPPLFLMPFFAIMPVHCLTIILQYALAAFYLIHVIRNASALQIVRIILGVGTFFAPFVAMPVYYYTFIWRDQPPEWAVEQAPAAQAAER